MCERLSNVTILHLQRVRRLAFFYRAYRKQSLDQLTKRLTGELLGLFEEKPKTVVPPRQNTRDPDRCQQDPLRVPYTRPEWLVIIVVYILGNDRVDIFYRVPNPSTWMYYLQNPSMNRVLFVYM